MRHGLWILVAILFSFSDPFPVMSQDLISDVFIGQSSLQMRPFLSPLKFYVISDVA